jgi:RNA polymerase sigma-70 factor, ECF subfamily
MFTQSRILKRLLNPAGEVDWTAVYTEHLPRLYNYFRYRTGDDALAEDLTSATFEKAWSQRHKYRRDLGAFSTWLYTIARRVAIDHFRMRQPAVPLEETHLLAGEGSVEETYYRMEEMQRLGDLLRQLPERERDLVALKYGAGLNNRQIAEQTGLSESNVGTILHRAVQKLRAGWEAEK